MHIQKLNLVIIFLLIQALAIGQKQGNTWHFGLHAGLDFNTNPPTITTTGQTNSREGVAAISDKTTGQLLFYTEGTTVWNRNHAVMPNGTGLLGDFSSTQSAIAVPKPGNANRYYLFTTALLKGMFYSELDMALAGGNGDIVAGTKNTPLINSTESSEKLIAVKHCNGVDYWVLTHKLFSNSFVVYLVNAAGVQPGITYNIGAILGDGNAWTGVGYLKLSPNGNRLAHVIGPTASGQDSNVELLNFDNKTGIIAGPVVALTNFNFPYGAEFSPKGRYLYISENLGRRIFQYDLGAANINASQILIQPPSLNYGALQLGPDGKIYVAAENGYNTGYNFLGRIENPDATGTACNFVPNAVNLGTGQTLIGLPTLAADYLLTDSLVIKYTGLCAGVSGDFSFTVIPNVDSVKWNFGDGSPHSNLLAPPHTYTAANTYNVQLVLYKSCNKNDTINKPVTVTNCAANCNNWLSTPSSGSYVTVGDLDVVGNQITVEANFNRTVPLNNGLFYGHLVSKHTGAFDMNYALLPNGCEIGTTNGYFSTFQNCLPDLNKTYHVAMVYDGAMLKFYRNGFLHSQTPCTGNMLNNNLQTVISQIAGGGFPFNNQFMGYVNEVRIWNVARTQAQLQTYMNSSLPNPSTQPGLLGYYTFDNLLNKQGNAAFNATLNGAATINATNTSCSFVADSCRVNTPIGNIINAYTPVLGLAPCGNKITVENATAYNVGDTVLLIQMKGAVIDSTNTAAFGTVTDYKSAGNYEFNHVKSKVGNVIELKNKLTRTYEIPNGKVQLIRVPYYDNATIANTLTCLPWDGSKGGVLVLNVKDTVVLNANINVKGKGFRGGGNPNLFNTSLACFENNYTVPSGTTRAAAKGESIYLVGNANSCAKGPNASGGGGGNGHNSGGGGGGNGGPGGLGGYQLLDCGSSPYDNRGLGGKPLAYNNVANKVFLGGGGGGGHTDNGGGIDMKGGNGGGIVIINANHFKGNSFAVLANGDSGQICNNALNNCHDGSGGGGAGGSVLLNINNFINAAPLQAIGGKGADLVLYNPGAGANKIGPGGGGGGGTVWLKASALPANVSTNLAGGANGSILQNANDPWGATSGQAGTVAYNLVVPFDTVPFKPNIDSVRIKDSLISCKTIDFKGLGFTNTAAIAQWNWTFGDGGTANTQNAAHTYPAESTTYTVKLVVTDINGCKDSVVKTVSTIACTSGIGNIINAYTPVLGLDPCANKITVENATPYNVGDTVLLIQMKGAVIDSTNTATFGTVTDYKSAGNYEFNYVKAKVGNVIELKNQLTRTYEIPNGKVQLIRVPYYTSTTITNTLTCLPWDGNKGGVLVFNVADSLILAADIDVSGKGFWGGNDPFTNPTPLFCNETGYYYPTNADLASEKGEGIANISTSKSFGRGALANGGGGGISHNSGGGGGSHAGIGGMGGYQYEGSPCNTTVPFDNRGLGGKQLQYGIASAKVFLGGGGGAGHSNNPEAFQSKGGNGAGIVIVTADKIKANTRKIIANGDPGAACGLTTSGCHEGMGGGGAGGNIFLGINNYLDNTVVEAKGGKGADMTSSGFQRVAPGGGGGGGMIVLSGSTVPTNTSISVAGGANGVCTAYANDPWGATAGQVGSLLLSLRLTVDTIPFKPNIDSVRIKDSLISCKIIDFKGLGFTNTAAIAQWNWNFGDGGTANTQNAVHTYANAGTYSVKLVVTDINGCKDSVSKPVTINLLTADAGRDTTVCSNGNVSINLLANGGTGYSWSPAGVVSNPNIANPVATVNATTKLYVTVTNAAGCSGTDSVTITINALPTVKANNDTAICSLQPLPLLATGAATYVWSPAAAVSNPTIANPSFVGTQAQQLIVTGTSALGCRANDTVQITVNPLPLVKTIGDTISCNSQTLVLTTTGAQSYQWSPATFLSNPNVANPSFTGTASQTYQVTGTDANGCVGKDTVSITLPSIAALRAPVGRSLCRQDTVILDGNNGPGFQYAWSPAIGLSNPLVEKPVFSGTVTTPYVLTITEPLCSLQRNFNILVTVNPLPLVNATRSNDIDCASPSSQLQASGALQYVWQPNNISLTNPVVTPTATTLYIVKGTDANGCSGYDSVEVKVFANGKDFAEMPNSFTPNGDGINDCYGPGRFWRNIITMELIIYNRWGERVFYSTNPANCWDGTFKGVNAEANAYVYQLKVKTTCGSMVKKGHVILIR